MIGSLDRIEVQVSNWQTGAEKPFVLGICGAQGSGKSTLAEGLACRLSAKGQKVALLSLDDLYISRAGRAKLAEALSPLFATRGVPSTHDVALGERVIEGLKTGKNMRLPRFDKASDEPLPMSEWPECSAPNVIIFEGWCIGARPQTEDELTIPVNRLEATEDTHMAWRQAVNVALHGPYASLFAKIDRLIFLAAPDFEIVRDWRFEQEQALCERLKQDGRTGGHIMSHEEISRFVQYYQRLTQHMMRTMPGYADLTLWLDHKRQVVRQSSPNNSGI